MYEAVFLCQKHDDYNQNFRWSIVESNFLFREIADLLLALTL